MQTRTLALIAACAVALCQSGPPLQGQEAPAAASGNLPAQPVGPTDLLALSVYGAPELTRTLRVSELGTIRIPMLRQPIEVNGLLPAQVEEKIAEALASNEILVDPQVTVTIAEYHSRPISVAGAVKSPVTFQAWGKTTLLEALTRAGGLSDEAGAEILLTRAVKADGSAGVIERIPVRGLIQAADPVWNVTLEGGEEVRVLPVGKVFVVGNVKKPGAFRADDGTGMSVLKALAMAEGLAPFALNTAYIYRRGDGAKLAVPAVGATPGEVPVELRKIMDRKMPDVALEANDVLYVPDHRSRRLTTGALERAIGFAVGTASGALILGVNR